MARGTRLGVTIELQVLQARGFAGDRLSKVDARPIVPHEVVRFSRTPFRFL